MRPRRFARAGACAALLVLAACTDRERGHFLIPADAFGRSDPPTELTLEDSPGSIMSAVIAGDLLVGGQLATGLEEPAAAEPGEARQRQARQAMLVERWMSTRAEPATLTRDDVRRGQRLLAELGFDPGPIDGIMGPRTRAAIEAFQAAQSIEVTGRMSRALIDFMALLDV
jgi:hypothetical protein